MEASEHRPLLLLDVDGPLNPFAARGPLRLRGYRTYRMLPDTYAARCVAAGHPPRPLRVRLNPAHGPRLLALGCELVWATAWAEEANIHISPVLGLPSLPVIGWPDGMRSGRDGLLWKTRNILAWVAGRPFAWVDDALTVTERRFVGAHHPGPALLHRVDPTRGLRNPDFGTLARWATAHSPTTGDRKQGPAREDP